ncbi:MAG: 3-hydroxyacyl-CoA dehydrogenase, partial [Kiloniellales bacterium]
LYLPGPSGKATLDFALRDLKAKGLVTPHDEVVVEALVGVLTGGPKADHTEAMSEEQVHALELAALMGLVRTEPTLARMEHMLETGKPLRN